MSEHYRQRLGEVRGKLERFGRFVRTTLAEEGGGGEEAAIWAMKEAYAVFREYERLEFENRRSDSIQRMKNILGRMDALASRRAKQWSKGEQTEIHGEVRDALGQDTFVLDDTARRELNKEQGYDL